MQTDFALSLSFEGIDLLRRTGAGWAVIDSVALDSADLDSAMNRLRQRAETIDPEGARVSLIIPNEQIRYLDLPDSDATPAGRDSAISAALDGATPYAVAELVYDYKVSARRLLIAAVAQETLAEAEAFAQNYGFRPVSFLARAEADRFVGAIFFGAAASWKGPKPTRPPEAIVTRPANPEDLVPVASQEPSDAPPDAPAPAPAPARDRASARHAPSDRPAAPPLDQGAPEAQEAPASPAGADSTTPKKPSLGDPVPPPVAQDSASDEPQSPDPDAPIDAPETTDRPALAPAPAAPPLISEGDATAQTAGPASAPAESLAAETAPAIADALAETTPPGTAEDTAPEPAAPPARFASIRASKTDAPPPAAAPAPAPVMAPVERRFTPVLPAPNPAREAGVTSKSIAADTGSASDGSDGGDTSSDSASASASAATAAGAVAAGAASAAYRFISARLSRGTAKADTASALDSASVPTAPAAGGKTPVAPRKSSAAKQPAVSRQAKAAPSVPPAPTLAARETQAGPTRSARPQDAARGGTLDPVPPMPGPLAALSQNQQGSAALAAAATLSLDDERARMTVFGARKREATQGKPRFLALLLTAALLLFLAAVAAWASVFLDDGLARLFQREDRATTIAAAPDLQTAPLADTGDTPAAGSAAPLSVAAPAPLALPDRPALPKSDDAPAPAPDDLQLAALEVATDTDDPVGAPGLARPLAPRALTPQEAAATYAATGIWQRAPAEPHQPPVNSIDDVYVASIDPAVRQSDAVALPPASRLDRDAALADPGLPPPPGLRFFFDERNLVRATPEGALTPDGLRIYTGPPPVVPPLRNAVAAPPPTSEPESAQARGALAGLRPLARPRDLVEQRERATLQGITRTELAALRPVMRPKTAQEQETEVAPDATATDRAVDRSLTPVPRPRDFARIVERAQDQSEAAPVQVAAAATAVPRTVQPDIPSSASVARAATVRNAINLGQINLIGVYGTASNRRALVRLPSGGYRKVQVGDRLDGGRITAISEDELRYTVGGRNLVLKMPR